MAEELRRLPLDRRAERAVGRLRLMAAFVVGVGAVWLAATGRLTPVFAFAAHARITHHNRVTSSRRTGSLVADTR